MHIQLRQSGLLLRNIKIYWIYTSFIEKQFEKRKPNYRRQQSNVTVVLSLSRCSAG